ncbi:Guanine/hypoxanthine permease PbuG [Lactobacillus helveticus]|nr:Guanine/hypoxanthine permease PbuG [Lactobacillus helveticus]
MNFIKNYFQLDKYKTSIKVEFIAGLTTFISMSYILFVNPSVLGASGMNTGAVFTATALASVFVASILFILITLFKLREKIIDSILADLKFAISSGIGLFIAFLGLQNGKLIVANKSTLVGLGSLHDPLVWITIFGLLVTVILMILNVPGAIFIGMVLAAVFGICTGQIALPHKIISTATKLSSNFWSSCLPR